MAANKSTVAVQLTTPPPPGLQESVRNSTATWQRDLETLFKNAKDRFPDVVWEFVGADDEDDTFANGTIVDPRISTAIPGVDQVWGHKAIVYARAPPSFQSRYFSFRPNQALPYASSPTDDHFPGDSTASLDTTPASLIARTPSPSSSLLRITTTINPTLFSNELEYLYTGQGFGEAFEFLFDSAGSEDGTEDLRIDKLRKDLVFMWRSRLYSDVRIALTSSDNTTAIFSSHRFVLVSRCPYFHDQLIAFGGTESPTLTLPSPPFTPASLHFTLGYIYTGTLVFSHRSYDLSTAFAILRAALYLGLTSLHDEIQARIAHEMLHGLFHAFLPFPEYEALTQGRWGTGGCRCRQCARRVPRVLEFSLSDDVRNAHLERGARRALVGMFGEGWCTAEFASLAQKLRESLLKGVGKRTTPVNAFPLLFAADHALIKIGNVVEPWADTVREMINVARKGVDELVARDSEACFTSDEWTTIMESESEGGGAFGDLEKVEWAMASALRGVKEPWSATLYQTLVSGILLRPHPTEETEPMLSATSQLRVVVEETRLELLKWIGKRWIMVRQEQGFDNLEGWALKEISDHIEVPIEDLVNPPAANNAAAHSRSSPSRGASAHPKPKPTLLRPMSHHPHTSRIDSDSDLASSMRASVLTRNSSRNPQSTTTTTNSTTTTGSSAVGSRRRGPEGVVGRLTPTRGGDGASIVSSVRSSATSRSTATFDSAQSGNTVGRSIALRRRGGPSATGGRSSPVSTTRISVVKEEDSPAKRIAASVRARNANNASSELGKSGSLRERPDSKLTPDGVRGGGRNSPSILESRFDDEDLEDEYDQESVFGGENTNENDNEGGGEDGGDDDRTDDGARGVGLEGESRDEGGESDNEDEDRSTPANSTMSITTTGTTPSRKPVRGGRDSLSRSGRRTPVKKMLITKASLSSITSSKAGGSPAARNKSSNASLRSRNTSVTSPSIRKTSGGSNSNLSLSIRTGRSPRPSSRGSVRSTVTTNTMQSRTTMSTNTNVSAHSRSTMSSLHSRPVSRSSLASSLSANSGVTGGSGSRRPVSSVSGTTDSTNSSFRTASSGGRTPVNTSGNIGFSGISGIVSGVGGGAAMLPRSRRTSGASTVSVKSTATARTTGGGGGVSPVNMRQRKISTGSVGSVASVGGGRSPGVRKGGAGVPPVPLIDPKKLAVVAGGKGAVKAPIVRTVASTGGVRKVVEKKSVGALSVKKGVQGKLEKDKEEGKGSGTAAAAEEVKAVVEKDKVDADLDDTQEKENIQPPIPAAEASPEKKPAAELAPPSLPPPPPSLPQQPPSEHRKTSSSTSTSSVSSVATVKRRGSVDTITTVRTKGSSQGRKSTASGGSHLKLSPGRATSPPLPPVPFEDEDDHKKARGPVVAADNNDDDDEEEHDGDQTLHLYSTPRGATLDIGIPCIISSKRKRFKAYARYIGEVEGEDGSWVGVEVPMPVSGSNADAWGDRSAVYSSMSMNSNGNWPDDDRQWNDGSWGGVRYFEISGGATEWAAEDRASRRRRVDGGSAGAGAVWGRGGMDTGSMNSSVSFGKGSLKREATEMSMSLERMMKRVRSASPAGSDTSSMTETRGLFVRPQQVLYVVEAVGADM